MALVEIARFTDVYEADLAAAFLASHRFEVSVTELLTVLAYFTNGKLLGIIGL